jgi:branched-chain amino acid transport system ATP-binding protein
MNNDIILTIENISVCYGPIKALTNVSLHINHGEVVTILGANGAGKTTLLRAISGLVPLTSGNIIFDGKILNKMKPHLIVSMGIVHCPEGRHIFTNLTVRENLEMGGYILKDRKSLKENMDRIYSFFPVLAQRQNQRAGTLSGGEQQMLALGRALMTSPRLILLDEPSLGLAPILIKQIFDTIKKINSEAHVSILLVEQNAREALLYSHRGYVLENGVITTEGPSSQLRNDKHIIEAYLGG